MWSIIRKISSCVNSSNDLPLPGPDYKRRVKCYISKFKDYYLIITDNYKPFMHILSNLFCYYATNKLVDFPWLPPNRESGCRCTFPKEKNTVLVTRSAYVIIKAGEWTPGGWTRNVWFKNIKTINLEDNIDETKKY